MAREGPSSTSQSLLLRQRFRTLSQLTTHLHPVEGSFVLFFRPPAVAPGQARPECSPAGTKVLVEVNCDENGQQAILRGTILGSLGGEERGLWLQFQDGGLRKRAGEQKVAFRGQRRVGCEQLVHVVSRGAPQLARLVDLSLNGAQVSGVSGFSAGDTVAVQLNGRRSAPPAELGTAKVVFSNSKGAGLRFERNRPESRMAITRLFADIQEEWQRAPEAVHPAICCRGGPILDPALPKVRSRYRFG
jgi:hypothetical protein